MTTKGLEALFAPRAVALVGSVGEGKLGYELLRQMLAGGFDRLIAVNPKGQGALGVRGCTGIGEAGMPIDLAVIASPAHTVGSVLEECGLAGVQAAVIVSSGFGETGNRAAEEEVKRAAAERGIRIVGPNCAGIINTAHKLTPTLETIPPAGRVAIISQSGAFAGVLLGWAKRDGLGISKFVSYGNRADVNEVDLVEYLTDDPETDVVCVYIETVSDGRAFMKEAARCAAAKPVVVIKAGRGESGQRATLSHTGSLAGSDAVYDAALQQCGALRVGSAEEMFDLCRALTSLPHLRGKRVAIVTNSGGPSILAADRAEALGLEVAEPGAAIKSALSTFLPAHAALKNPIDLTVEGTERGYRETITAIFAAETAEAKPFDAVVAINIAPPYLDSIPLAVGIANAAQATGKAVVTSFLPETVTADAIAYLHARGVPNLSTPERAVAALANMVRLGEIRAGSSRLTQDGVAEGIERPALPAAPILEPDAMLWLAGNEISTPVFLTAETEEEAAAACYGVGFPAVMKVVSPDILHKSERGGVIVGIRDEAAAVEAFRGIRQRAAGARFASVIVYPLIKSSHEVLIGLSRDAQFGPVVAFGLGGIYTEILSDVALRVAPVDHATAHGMMRSLRGYRLLAGARGQRPVDLHALADLIVRVSALPFAYPQIVELDLNPVFVSPAGAVAGDVRIVRGEPWSSRNVA